MLEAALEVGRRLKVLHASDVGTGTGILAICHGPGDRLGGGGHRPQPGALAVAQDNAAALGARVRWFQGDLLAPVPDPVGLVVANPPYVDPADVPALQRELAFEPPGALFAEDRGLAVATAALAPGPAPLRARAACWRSAPGRATDLTARAKAAGWKRVQVHQDLAGHDRVLMAVG